MNANPHDSTPEDDPAPGADPESTNRLTDTTPEPAHIDSQTDHHDVDSHHADGQDADGQDADGQDAETSSEADRPQADQPQDLWMRMAGPEGLIEAVPYLLGYDPGARPDTNTMVVIKVDGDLATGAVTAEYDLPYLMGAWVALTTSIVLADADAFLIVVYGTKEQLPFLQALCQQSTTPIVDAVVVHQGHWWDALCIDRPSCGHPACTPEGAPITGQARDAYAGAFEQAGVTDPQPWTLLTSRLQPGPVETIRAVAALLPPHPPRLDPTQQDPTQQGVDPDSAALIAELSAARQLRQEGLHPLSPLQAARMLIGLCRPAVRVTCSTWSDPAAVQLWTDLLHITPPAWRAVAAVQLGLAAYLAGDELLTGLAIEQSLAADPDHDLAVMLAQAYLKRVPAETLRAGLLLAQHVADHDTDGHDTDGQSNGHPAGQ